MTNNGDSPDKQPENWPESVLADVCAHTGYDPAKARLIKFTNNAVFDLTTAPVIVRIPGSAPVDERADKIVAVARWLAGHAMSSVRLINDVPQPLTVAGRRVTLWHRVPAGGASPNGRDLGAILRRYHSLPTPQFDLPAWQPIAGVRKRIDVETVLTDRDHRFLHDQCDELETALEHVDYVLPSGPIHGDSFTGNLIPSPAGAVICDFDSAAIGPREWDLTPVAVGRQRFSYTTDFHRQLSETYGIDILQWDGFPVLRKLRELQLVTSVLPVLRTNATLIEQWRHRFTTFRDGNLAARWKPYT